MIVDDTCTVYVPIYSIHVAKKPPKGFADPGVCPLAHFITNKYELGLARSFNRYRDNTPLTVLSMWSNRYDYFPVA